MAIIVQKYGGSSVAGVEKLKNVARRVAKAKQEGNKVVVVVSAMGDTTDELLELARKVTPNPDRREHDMLVSAGERISMALLAMALKDMGHDAISFTGSQSGIMTNDRHVDARIIEVRPFRIQDELDRGRIVIVAGFQGVSYRREITTLGRGGSDTTAVALAAALDADRCEIYSDVDGVYSADPRVVEAPVKIPELSYQEMQEMAEAGAKVLNSQAVEFAKEKGIAIYARSTFSESEGSVIRKFAPKGPGRVIAAVSESDIFLLGAVEKVQQLPLSDLLRFLDSTSVAGKQFSFTVTGDTESFSLVVSKENLPGYEKFVGGLEKSLGGRIRVTEGIGAVSLIGAGITTSYENMAVGMKVLGALGASPLCISTSSFRITYVLPTALVRPAVRACHKEFIETGGPLVP